MSCAPLATFRLLDARVGWDVDSSSQLVGFESEAGVRLAAVDPDEVSAATVLPYLFPRRLAKGPGHCEWLLASAKHPLGGAGNETPPLCEGRVGREGLHACTGGLLKLSDCAPPVGCPPDRGHFDPFGPRMVRSSSVSCAKGQVAAADFAGDEVLLLDGGGRVRGRIPFVRPFAVVLAPWGEVIVATVAGALQRFGLEGAPRGSLPPVQGRVVATRAEQGQLFIAHQRAGRLHLACFDRSGAPLPHAVKRLRTLPPTRVARFSTAGFCWTELPGRVADCLDWCGRPASRPVKPFDTCALAAQGEMICGPFDGTDPRTVWHRLRADADVPSGATLSFSYATLDDTTITAPEWHDAPTGLTDFLIQAPPGRYLVVRARFDGDGRATPRVRQVRLDFPRVTSAELLPDVYFEDPRAADFTERFVSLFDAELGALDEAIETFPRWLQVHSTGKSALGWLGGLVGLSFDSLIGPRQRRALIAESPRLFAARGTPWGLRRVLQIVTGVDPAISEERSDYGALRRPGVMLDTDARLDGVRLFSAAATRFRTGRSRLGEAKVRSFGNPDADPWAQTAWRLSVSFPLGLATDDAAKERLRRLVRALTPAHLLVSVGFGLDGGWRAGLSRVGIDTALTSFPAPALGANTRLNRQTVLWPSVHRRATGLELTPFAQGAA